MSEKIRKTAAEMATDFEKSGTVVSPRSEIHRQLKRRLDVSRIDHESMRSGFEEAGWTYSRHLYFHPEGVDERAREVAAKLRAEGRLLAEHGDVCDRIVDGEDERRDRITGWDRGAFAETVVAAFEGAEWRTDLVERRGREKRFYLLPLFEVFRRNHPGGEPPFSTVELFSYYLSESVESALTSR